MNMADDEIGLFDIPKEEKELTPGQRANKIFKEWYAPFYKGKYTQEVGHIMRVLTQAIKHDINEEELRLALKELGKNRQAVTSLSLQRHLVIARNKLNSNTNMTGMEIELNVEEFDPTNADNY